MVKVPEFEELKSWDEVRGQFSQGAALLLGNGMSRSVWDRFEYPSLYETACNVSTRPLTPESQRLFQHVGGSNFEHVLGLLIHADIVNGGLGIADGGKVQTARDNIRDALIDAVRWVHIPWTLMTQPNLDAIREELTKYITVYTTNYDLLPYWALMTGDGPDRFKDFFVNGSFEKWPTGNRIPIFYLHGALHLYTTPDYQTKKRAHADGENLLDQFDSSFENDNRPLFVSEGDWKGKLVSIHDSDYLTFAFESFKKWQGKLVVFGHGLDPAVDQHVVDALAPAVTRRAAIAVYPPNSTKELDKIRAGLRARFPAWDVTFFDQTTHPLGLPARKVVPPTPAAPTPAG